MDKETIDKSSMDKDEKFLATALERFKQCVEQTEDLRQDWLDDVKFANGEQWDDAILKERSNDKRPALTINKLPATYNQVVNEFRQNRPSIKVRPVDSLSDPDKADVINGLYRRIQNQGDYKTAVDEAFYYSVIGGFGFVRVKTDFVNAKSMDQDIFLERIQNPCMVYFPVEECVQPDYSDAMYCFVRTKMTKEAFKAEYPKAELSSWEDTAVGDSAWADDKFVYVAEYFWVELEPATLVLFDDGTTETTQEGGLEGQILPDGRQIVKVRMTELRSIHRAVISHGDILEPDTVFAGQWLPIVPMLGQEVNIDGEKRYISLTRFAKDPQKMFNYWMSAFTEQVGLAPKAPWMVVEGQIAGYENQYRLSNTKNIPFLTYKPITVAGVPVGAPQRNQPPEVGSAIIQGIQFASDNLKAVTGIYDASLGNQGNETSGRAINARLRQSNTGNFHYSDNAAKSLRHIGRIIKDMLPVIYDSPDRIVRIVGEDMTDKVIKLNEQAEDGIKNNMTVGEYDVVVDVGASYETKRAEMVDTMSQLTATNPAFGQFAPDLLAQNIDAPIRDELTKRMKAVVKMQFPQLIEDDDKEGQEITPEQMQQMQQQYEQQMQEMQAQIQQLDQIIEKMSTEIETKQNESQLKLAVEQMHADLQKQLKQMDMQMAIMKENHESDRHAIDTGVALHTSHNTPMEVAPQTSLSQPSGTMDLEPSSMNVGETYE